MQFRKAAEASELPQDEYLSPEQVLELQHVLIDQANTILSTSRNTVSRLAENRKMDPDHLDQASSESERDFSLRLAGRNRHLLNKIRHALRCMEDGEYGTCESCGVPIGYKRLMVRPVARVCIDCKTQAEQLERRSRAI